MELWHFETVLVGQRRNVRVFQIAKPIQYIVDAILQRHTIKQKLIINRQSHSTAFLQNIKKQIIEFKVLLCVFVKCTRYMILIRKNLPHRSQSSPPDVRWFETDLVDSLASVSTSYERLNVWQSSCSCLDQSHDLSEQHMQWWTDVDAAVPFPFQFRTMVAASDGTCKVPEAIRLDFQLPDPHTNRLWC